MKRKTLIEEHHEARIHIQNLINEHDGKVGNDGFYVDQARKYLAATSKEHLARFRRFRIKATGRDGGR